jgi:hypothetical protein
MLLTFANDQAWMHSRLTKTLQARFVLQAFNRTAKRESMQCLECRRFPIRASRQRWRFLEWPRQCFATLRQLETRRRLPSSCFWIAREHTVRYAVQSDGWPCRRRQCPCCNSGTDTWGRVQSTWHLPRRSNLGSSAVSFRSIRTLQFHAMHADCGAPRRPRHVHSVTTLSWRVNDTVVVVM